MISGYYGFAQIPTNLGAWCNGNTTVFGAVILGSNPSVPTNWELVEWFKTEVFEASVKVAPSPQVRILHTQHYVKRKEV